MSDRKPFAFSSFVDIVQWRAEQQPEQRAYTFLEVGDDRLLSWNYAQLAQRAQTIAAYLQDQGHSGERALLLYPPGLEYIAAFFGCLLAGVVAVPAYPPSFKRDASRLRNIVDDCQPVCMLTTQQILTSMRSEVQADLSSTQRHWIPTDIIDTALAQHWHRPDIHSNTLALLQYTSGSTSTPKGVMLTHQNLLHNSALIASAFETDETIEGVNWLPPYHDMGLIGGILQPLFRGFPVTLMHPVAFLQHPVRWLTLISQQPIVTMSGGPDFAFRLCTDKITAAERATLDLSRWELAFCGAEPIQQQTLIAFAEAFASCGFRYEAFYPCYGLAEASLLVTGGKKATPPALFRAQRHALKEQHAIAAQDTDEEKTIVGCGTIQGDQEIVIVDPQSTQPCADGEIGEIWIHGPSVAQGYWGQSALTAHTFQAHLADKQTGPFLRTGDLGFFQGHELFVTGRFKDLIIVRGRNYYPHDLEATTAQCHRYIRTAGVAAFSITEEAEEKLVVVAEINRQHRDAPLDDVLRAIRQAIAETHEVTPHTILLVKPGSIPKTSSGKIQHHLCTSLFVAHQFVTLAESSITGNNELPPISVTGQEVLNASAEQQPERLESYLRQLFAQAVALPLAQIAPTCIVSSLGLDSLSAIELQHHIEQELNVTFPPHLLLSDLTLNQLVEHLLPLLRGATSQVIEPTRTAPNTPLPLSYGQRALWFIQQLDPKSNAYNIGAALLSHTPLNSNALQQALQALIQRHPILRTTFMMDNNGTPFQVLHPASGDYFTTIDASTLDEPTLKARLHQLVQLPFNLCDGPLIRLYLFENYLYEKQVLLLAIHHSITDFWSLEILLQELLQFYQAAITGGMLSLPSLTTTYADYVSWQADFIASSEGERHWEYWREQLQGELPMLLLPTDKPRTAVKRYDGLVERRKLTPELSHDLQELSRSQSVTLHTLLLTAYLVLLHRYTGQKELLLGTATSGRVRAEFSPLLGYFVNPVVIRAHIDRGLAFLHFLKQVRHITLAALEHQAYPFPLLIERLNPERGHGQTSLFQTLFIFQQKHLSQGGHSGAQIPIASLMLEELPLEECGAPFDLTMRIVAAPTELTIELEYRRDLFEHTTIQRMLEHFSVLLQHMVISPQQQIALFPLLGEREQRQLVRDWNASQQAYPLINGLHQLFEAQAELTPERSAIFCNEGSITYNTLEARANQLARFLRKRGIGPEVLVGLCVERSLEMVVGILGILKAGGAYVPLDPSYPIERLHFMQRDSHICILLTQKRFATLALEGLDSILLDDDWWQIAQEPMDRLSFVSYPDQMACILYTSGSTGKPKAVIEQQNNLVNRYFWHRQAYPLHSDDHCCLKTAISFVDAIGELFSPLLQGALIVILTDEQAKNPELLLQQLAQQQISRILLVPALLRTLLESYPDLAQRLPSLWHWTSSGEAVSPDLTRLFHEILPGRTLTNLYGSSEVGPDASYYDIPPGGPLLQRIPIGHVISNAEIYLLDEQFQLVPIGVTGEIYVGGLVVTRGYLNQPTLTAERFLPNPFSQTPGTRLYKTGDLGRYRTDGILEYLGRSDHQVKVRGNRVELGEIEAVLKQHPAVSDALVTTQEHAGEQALIAYVTLQREAQEQMAQTPQFSLFYFADNGAITETERYQLYLESARFADTHGFTAIWTPERHFHAVAGLYPNPSVLSAALAMITERIQLRAGSVVLPLQNPLRVAEEWAIVDNLSKGRVGLAFASGWVPNDFVFYPEHFARKREVLFQGLQQVRQLWRGEPIAATNGVGASVQVRVFPLPLQPELPIWLTCTSDPAQFEKAGELGVSVLTALLSQTLEEAEEKIALYRRSLVQHGHDPQQGHVTMMLHTFLGEDLEETIALIRAPFCQYMKSHVGLIETMVKSLNLQIDFTAEKELDMLAELAFERYRQSAALFGTPESCLPLVERLSAIGVDEIACLIDFGMSFAEVMGGLQQLDRLRQISQHQMSKVPHMLRETLQAQLPDYMLPRGIIQLEQFPLLPNGKVNRQELPLPSITARGGHTPYVEPQTEAEARLIDIWQRVLQIERIGMEDNFFELGGHSLLAVKIVTAVHDTFEINLPLASLFQDPTPRGMATLMKKIQAEEQAQLATIARLMQQIEDLSTEDVERLLKEKQSFS
ncbi:MAG TPA: amino acid adenylation domain-containing protein [Ktedonobacteraceae bacterium]|nr:amino acid adenylation domain-containing protein [Ktedonobacteraceae bacterium]